MGITFLTLILLLPFNSQAFTESELNERKAILTEFNEASAYADSHLPPCEGHDRLSEAFSKHPPPKSCPKSRAFYESIEKFDSEIRKNCWDMSRWLEDLLRNEDLCSLQASPNELVEAQKKLNDFRKEINRAFEEQSKDLSADDTGLEFSEEAKGKGEFARNECATPVILGMQFRKRQLSLGNKHYGTANMALDEACNPNGEDKENYLLFLRGGEDALPDSAEEPAGRK